MARNNFGTGPSVDPQGGLLGAIGVSGDAKAYPDQNGTLIAQMKLLLAEQRSYNDALLLELQHIRTQLVHLNDPEGDGSYWYGVAPQPTTFVTPVADTRIASNDAEGV